MSTRVLDYAHPPKREDLHPSHYGTTACLVLCFIIASLISARLLNEPALALFAAPLSVCGLLTAGFGLFEKNVNPTTCIWGLLLNAAAAIFLFFNLHRVLLP